MKIKHENGIVTFVMRTGKTFVRSTTSIDYAESVVKNGKEVTEVGNEIRVDDTYIFPAEHVTKSTRKTKGGEIQE